MSQLPPDPGQDGPKEALPGANYALWLLIGINLFNYIDRQILSAVLPQIKESFFAHPEDNSPVIAAMLKFLGWLLKASPENTMVSLLSMAFLLSYIIAAPLLSDLRIRRWLIIAGGVIVWSLASGGSGLATGFGVLLLTRCFVGVGEAAYGPVAPSLIAEYFPVSQRGAKLAMFYLPMSVGSALGFALGGYIGEHWGWRMAFFFVVPWGIVLGYFASRLKDPKPVAQKSLARTQSRWTQYRGFFKNRSYMLNTVAMTLMTFAIGGMAFWMPTYIHEYRHAGTLASVNITFGGILVLSGLTATLSGGYLADKIKGRFKGSYFLVSGWAMILAFPACLGIVYVPFPTAWILVFLACFFLFFNTGPSNTALANVVAPSLRPSAFALNILLIHLFGDVLSPLVIGVISDATGSMSKAFMVVSVLVLVGGIVWLIAAPHLEHDTQKASQLEQ